MRYTTRIAALLCATIFVAGAAGFAIAQQITAPFDARVVVQKHESGAVEVGIEQGGERYLPEARFVSANAETGRWLRSSPVTVSVDVPKPQPEVVEVIVEVPVEVIVEVPVEPPVVPLSVRPSEHEDGGLVCLEQEDEEGNSWTWTDEADDEGGEATNHGTGFGVYMAGVWSGWANSLGVDGFAESDWQELRRLAAWHAQCSEHHGVDIGRPAEALATDPDDWRE